MIIVFRIIRPHPLSIEFMQVRGTGSEQDMTVFDETNRFSQQIHQVSSYDHIVEKGFCA